MALLWALKITVRMSCIPLFSLFLRIAQTCPAYSSMQMSATLLFSKLFVQGPVIILDLRDLPIEASYPVRGEGQVITVNRFTQHGIESHRLRHSLQVVPSRALVRPSLCFMES